MTRGIILARAADRAADGRQAFLETLLLLDRAELDIQPEAAQFVAGLIEDANTFASLVLDAADGFAHDEVERCSARQPSRQKVSA